MLLYDIRYITPDGQLLRDMDSDVPQWSAMGDDGGLCWKHLTCKNGARLTHWISPRGKRVDYPQVPAKIAAAIR